MKKMAKKMVFLNLRLNIHFSPLTFQIINFQFLTIYEIKCWSQTSFYLFFGPLFKREEKVIGF